MSLPDLQVLMRRKIAAALIIAGEVVATEARRSVQGSPRGGRTYEKYSPRRTHKASAAGEAPATDLGFLVRSITTEVDESNLTVYVLSAHAIAPYAKVLEYGSMAGGIQPRPFLRPALRKKEKEVTRIVRQAMRKALAEYGR
jgi:HK97 gp10 family phage protein